MFKASRYVFKLATKNFEQIRQIIMNERLRRKRIRRQVMVVMPFFVMIVIDSLTTSATITRIIR